MIKRFIHIIEIIEIILIILFVCSIKPFILMIIKFFCFKSNEVSFLLVWRLILLSACNCFLPCFSSASICLSPWTLIVFTRFANAFPSGQYVSLAWCIIWLVPESNIFSPVRHSHLSILPENEADIFAASLLTS